MAIQTYKVDFYNESYKRRNYFHYPTWVYLPYISTLISFCGLKAGDTVLDVGCGQGFFSYLLSKSGMKVCGVDISETGISVAESLYGSLGITFAAVDVQTVTFAEQFDCIFVRSCSLYNTDAFVLKSEITNSLLRHLKAGGTFIFAYNSNCSSKLSPTWRYHSFEDVRLHFSSYPNAEVFVLNKMTTYLLRKHSISPLATRLNIFLSKVLGVGGDLVCIFRKSADLFALRGPRTGRAEGNRNLDKRRARRQQSLY